MERGVFVQRSVSSEFVVIIGIGGEDPAQVRVAQDHDMVQALSPDRADKSFDVSILPGRSRRGWSVPNAHGSETSRCGMAVRGVSVPDEVSGCLIPGEGLSDLAGDPFGGRIGSDVDPHEVASLKLDDHQAIEQLEANGRHDKHINGGDVRRVIAEKGLPALRRWPSRRFMYLATVDWATSKPSLSSSPWMRGAPHSGLSRLISPMRARNSAETFGLPTRLRDRQRQ